MPQAPSSADTELKVRIEDKSIHTSPLNDTDVIESFPMETLSDNLEAETEVLDIPDFVDNLRAQMEGDIEKEIVLDSDDEGMDGTVRKGLASDENYSFIGGLIRRQGSTVNNMDLVRKMSSGNAFIEKQSSPVNSQAANEGVNPSVVTFEKELAGLSYLDSQEPGDLSQADALGVVDNFLSVTDLNLSPERPKIGKCDGKNSPLASGAKGCQSLARKVNIIKGAVESPFKWDDDQRDDGGELFLKTRNELLSDKQQENNRIDEEVPDILDVGLDTQIAVEAMEALIFAPPLKNDFNVHQSLEMATEDTRQGSRKKESIHSSSMKRISADSGVSGKQMKRKRRKDQNELNSELAETKKTPTGKPMPKNRVNGKGKKVTVPKNKGGISSRGISKRKEEKTLDKENMEYSAKNACPSESVLCGSVGKIQPMLRTFSPIASRTRNSPSAQALKKTIEESTCNFEGNSCNADPNVCKRRKRSESNTIKSSGQKRKCSKLGSDSSGEDTKSEIDHEGLTNQLKFGVWPYPKGKRSRRNGGNHAKPTKKFCALSMVADVEICGGSSVPSLNKVGINFGSASSSSHEDRKSRRPSKIRSPLERICDTNGTIKAEALSKIDEMSKQPRKKNSPRSVLPKELARLGFSNTVPSFGSNDLRRRRSKENIRILFSQNLDDEIVKQQKKLLARLGVSLASSCSDATHFVTNSFVRTRNMLEAIAHGKWVVTQLWLECCGQAKCLIDEKNYLLRDDRKEKELGFSLPVSLARAREHPLLKDKKVFFTSNVKPSKEMVVSLVKAVHGQAVEGIQKDAIISDDLLIVSCDEDYATCVPFLDKGAKVYSTEILLNGIVVQKLEYERHQLFRDHNRSNCSPRMRQKKVKRR